MRVVIVQTAFLGDVILTLPLCAAAKKLVPQARVVLVTTPAAAEFVRGLDVVDEVIAFDKRKAHRSLRSQQMLARSLRSDVPTTVLVPHKSLRTAIFVRSVHAQRVVTYRDSPTRWFATDVVPFLSHLHDAQRHLNLLQPILGSDSVVPTTESVLPLDLVGDVEWENINPWDAESSAPRIVLAPATVWPTKQWPIDRMKALARMCIHEGMQVCVIGDASIGDRFRDVDGVRDVSGRTTLRQASAIIASAACVIANDSAPTHLASLQQVGIVAIFGPTAPEFGFGPLGDKARIVQKSGLSCRPCSAHGGTVCPIRTHECMTGIDVGSVYQSVQSILAHDVNRHAKPHKEII